ncbi:MAG: SUMF1/EgtB/PvdO family nonheme iron enzyme [Candidatus Eremiobacteraeota bacterium]|nr:SUMF1/EgtB/PvdO family nonheme iron enzyme [Candidatus Eremiobacteraeota bacterium]
MLKVSAPARNRSDLVTWYLANRRRSAQLFALVALEAFESRPIPLRHPIVFYEGHLPAFSYITLVGGALRRPSIDERLEKLFQRGIDPEDDAAAVHAAPAKWPARAEVASFAARCDEAVIKALSALDLDDARLREAAYTILEHEQMHHETLLYIIHRLPAPYKRPARGTPAPRDGVVPAYDMVSVPTGAASVGARRADAVFGWDNEFEQQTVDVPAFEIEKHSVTNADYLRFVEEGGPVPPFWLKARGRWHQQALFGDVPLPLAWPVYATLDQATAFARWKGMRLASEAEYQRAAFGTPTGQEINFPWGDDPPDAAHGNFNFRNWDPVPAGSRPAGASSWGVEDLVGNGWEWTSSEFQPLPGFAPMASYPQYSADFFDAKHFVVKGASAVTAANLIRRSLRNWFRPNYPYIYTKFRCVS